MATILVARVTCCHTVDPSVIDCLAWFPWQHGTPLFPAEKGDKNTPIQMCYPVNRCTPDSCFEDYSDHGDYTAIK